MTNITITPTPVLLDHPGMITLTALGKELRISPELKADTLRGEITRAALQLADEFTCGNMIGIGEGREFCNPPARFLKKYTSGPISRMVPADFCTAC